MRKVSLGVLLFCLILSVTIVCGAQGGMEKPKNVILIGWDGAQRDHVKECLGRNELPNLEQLSREGTLVSIDILRITDTKAGWTQILTGYNPEITGVFSNGIYRPIPAGLTIFERLENHFGKDNIFTAAVIGKKGNVDAGPPVHQLIKPKKNAKVNNRKKQPGEKIVVVEGKKYRDIPGKPYYNTKDNMDVFINGLTEDQKVGTTTLDLLEKNKEKPFFFFVHFAEVDHSGHKHGENSVEYNDALKSADLWTGKIMDKLKELGLYSQTLIYITADHGFDEGKMAHRDAPYVFLATNDKKVIRRGERADITPTILDRYGLDLTKIDPPLNGHSLLRPYMPKIW